METKLKKETQLTSLKTKYSKCEKCPLAKQGRTQVVFGKGSENTKIMFIGEGPGKDEDQRGEPFAGRAGKLLDKMLEGIKLTRENIYITNAVKCRPPKNRAPHPEESKICKKLILLKEIEIIEPQIICCLGASATQAILGNKIKISKSRGTLFELTLTNQKTIKVMPTFHPAYLLRNPSAKRSVEEDLHKIISYLKIKVEKKTT
ncbi:MAG: uracil-DNA glycosylase [bacterium]